MSVISVLSIHRSYDDSKFKVTDFFKWLMAHIYNINHEIIYSKPVISDNNVTIIGCSYI